MPVVTERGQEPDIRGRMTALGSSFAGSTTLSMDSCLRRNLRAPLPGFSPALFRVIRILRTPLPRFRFGPFRILPYRFRLSALVLSGSSARRFRAAALNLSGFFAYRFRLYAERYSAATGTPRTPRAFPGAPDVHDSGAAIILVQGRISVIAYIFVRLARSSRRTTCHPGIGRELLVPGLARVLMGRSWSRKAARCSS